MLLVLMMECSSEMKKKACIVGSVGAANEIVLALLWSHARSSLVVGAAREGVREGFLIDHDSWRR